MKILINVPDLSLLGGVANHYMGLRPYWTERVRYNIVGRRNRLGNGKLWFPWDIIKFVWKLLTFRPDIIILNPSIGKSALNRDFIFLDVAHFLKFKVAVFIHGFDWNVAKSIEKEWISKKLNKTRLIFVLAKSFRKELRLWGVNVPIEITTTKVDDRMIKGFNIETRNGECNNLLFCSRVEKAKGIYEAIETFCILKERYQSLTLTIVGDGSEFAKVRQLIDDKGLQNIIMTGALSGEALIDSFKKSSVLLLLTQHGEGLPTAVLEGMAFGLPIITRNVGGIPDFFENWKMGFSSDSLDPVVFADAISRYLDNKEFAKETARHNYVYAKTHFMASNVALSIEMTMKKYC